MKKYTCPSCGADITFQSSITVSCVCPYCRSLIVRHDVDVEAIGKMAELPDDISPFCIGTTGHYRDIGFTLIGRMKIGWHDGCWNEWFMLTDGGQKGWLAEAEGFLAVSFEQPFASTKITVMRGGQAHLPPDTVPELGAEYYIQDKRYCVDDVKEAECIGSEGELPFAAPRGRKTKAVDFLGDNGEFAGLEYGEKDPPRLYIGEYVDFDNLRFGSLRQLPGWNIRQPAVPPHHGKKSA